MTFDIHRPIFDDDVPFEEAAQEYKNELLELFAQSPEAQAAAAEDDTFSAGHWASLIFDYAFDYIGVSIPQMGAGEIKEIVYKLFPQKVSTLPEAASEIIKELRLFWLFLQREFKLSNAASCLKVLNQPDAVDTLYNELNNPANYGMAKSMIMEGLKRGYDMSSEAGINEWFNTYNEEIRNNPPPPMPLPSMGGGWSLPDITGGSSLSQRSAKDKKKKRKMRQAAQRKNRKKK